MNDINVNPEVYAVPYPTEPVAALPANDEAGLIPPQTDESEPAPKRKKNVGYRIAAAILAVAAVAVAFLLDLHFFWPESGMFAVRHTTLFTAVKDTLAQDTKLFGILPAPFDATGIGPKIAVLAFYATLLFLVVTVVLGIVTVFTSKKAPALFSATAFFFAATFATIGASVWSIVLANWWENSVDHTALALTAVGVLCFVVASLIKNGKTAWLNLLQFVLTLAAMGAALYAFVKYCTIMYLTVETGFKWIALALVALISVCILLGSLRMRTKKGLTLDIVRFIVQFLVGALLCYFAIASDVELYTKEFKTQFLIFAIVAAAVSLIQLVVCIIVKKASAPAKEKVETQEENAEVENVRKEKVKKEKKQKKQKVAAQAEPVSAPEFVVEEYAEALPYEGGPVEGVEIAQEVNPTYVAPPSPVQTAGYDFYNSKSFDPFIAVLSNEERNQFTELFILKYKGPMPEVPDYQVGGDNKEFFRKLFIYLGQYRDRIPDGLLAKIYQFAVKM